MGAMLAGCVPVTVNVHFTQEKIDSAADRIVGMTRVPESGEAAPAPTQAPQEPTPAARSSRLVTIFPDLKVDTPETQAILQSLRNRVPKIRELRVQGCVGENNKGYLETRPTPGCDPKAAQPLVTAHNADRKRLAETIARQNSMPKTDVSRLEAALAKTRRERARPGEWIQLEDGSWLQR
jgi:uncharacterized protein YdbL (DUF1318 family)